MKANRWGSIRVVWTVLSSFAMESAVFGISALPAILFWEWHRQWDMLGFFWARTVLLSMVLIPAYLIFSVSLVVLSAGATKILGWRAPLNAEMPIRELGWPLMNWARYMVSVHVVRTFAGLAFRATPLWTFYMRLNGARMGRRVFVNSLWVTDHNMLEFGDDVVIGSEVHLSGHTVEGGIVKTAKIRLGARVTVGVSSVVGIGVEAGPGCQIGALSLVPKFSKLEAGRIYAGTPVREIHSHEKMVIE